MVGLFAIGRSGAELHSRESRILEGAGEANRYRRDSIPRMLRTVVPARARDVIAVPGLELVLLDFVLRPKGVRLDGEAVAGAPSGGAGEGVTILSDFFDFRVKAPGGVIRHPIAVQVTGILALSGRGIPTPSAKVGEAILLALRAGGERYCEIVIDVLDHAAAGSITQRIVARQILSLRVVSRSGAEAEFRALVVER